MINLVFKIWCLAPTPEADCSPKLGLLRAASRCFV